MTEKNFISILFWLDSKTGLKQLMTLSHNSAAFILFEAKQYHSTIDCANLKTNVFSYNNFV